MLPGQAAYIQGSGLANLTHIEIEYEERAWFGGHIKSTVKKVTAIVEHAAANGTSCIVRIPADLPLAAWTLSLPDEAHLQLAEKERQTEDDGSQ